MGHYIAFVHGTGEEPLKCYEEFYKGVKAAYKKELEKNGGPYSVDADLVWEEVRWSDITQPAKQEVKEKTYAESAMRRFAVGAIGEAITYAGLAYEKSKYADIQKRFSDAIARLGEQAIERGDTEPSLTVIAHCLGSVISSDGIYDMCHKRALPAITVDRFISMGSPMALFGMRYGLERFTDPIKPRMWINFWYPEDPMAFPLKTLNEAYAEAVTEDVCLPACRGENPIRSMVRGVVARLSGGSVSCHSWYFSDKRVIKRIAEALAQF